MIDALSVPVSIVVCTVRIGIGIGVFLFCLILGIVTETIAADDAYIAGYAAAVIHHEFKAPKASLLVQNGVVIVDAESLGTVDRTKVQAALASIPGVIRVEIREGPIAADIPASPMPQPVKQELPEPESKFLPHGLLFAPLHADPRWPHFSIAYRSIWQGIGPDKTGSANFGETFALYRDTAPLGGEWEIAVQAGVFSIFNMNASSKDLVNADYMAGLLTSYRTGSFSGFLRLRHQSAHLGDEFILNSRTPVNRINLSFEEIDLKLSYELSAWLRIYGVEECWWIATPKVSDAARANSALSSQAPGRSSMGQFDRWHMEIFRSTSEVIGRLAAPSWRDFNSRMPVSATVGCSC